MDVFLWCSTTGKKFEPFEAEFFNEAPEDLESILALIPPMFHEFAHLFSKVKAEISPPQRDCNHKIKLMGPPPKKGGIYQLLDTKDKVLREYIAENVAKGSMHPSKSPI